MISEMENQKKKEAKWEGKIEKSPTLPKVFTLVVKYRNK
jgi:hypothetical protein